MKDPAVQFMRNSIKIRIEELEKSFTRKHILSLLDEAEHVFGEDSKEAKKIRGIEKRTRCLFNKI